MGFFDEHEQMIANIISIAALALVPFNTRIRRTYSFTLDVVQMCFIFKLILTPSLDLFSGKLEYSFVSFMPNLLKYCSGKDFSCRYGFLLSLLLCWFVLVVISWIVVRVLRCRYKTIKFQNAYSFLKGIYRWGFGPLLFYCIV